MCTNSRYKMTKMGCAMLIRYLLNFVRSISDVLFVLDAVLTCKGILIILGKLGLNSSSYFGHSLLINML